MDTHTHTHSWQFSFLSLVHSLPRSLIALPLFQMEWNELRQVQKYSLQNWDATAMVDRQTAQKERNQCMFALY